MSFANFLPLLTKLALRDVTLVIRFRRKKASSREKSRQRRVFGHDNVRAGAHYNPFARTHITHAKGGEDVGRPRQYTPAKLKKAAEAWFKSITRIVRVTEEVDSGKRDEKGHAIYTSAEVLNQNGEPVEQLEYIVPPTVGGMCRALGISRSTWANYCDAKLNPEYEAATTWVRERLLEWNEQELLTRPGKDVKGILFNLQNNYDYTDRREVELGERASKVIQCSTMAEKLALLRELTEDDDEDADGSGR